MHPLLEKFMERPTSHKVIGLVLLLALVGFVFWQYFYSAKLREFAELQERIDTLSSQVTHEQRLANNIGKFRKEIAGLQAKLKLALMQLPDKREIPGLLSSIETLAKDAGLEVLRFAPQSEAAMDFYAAIPVQLELVGTYHQLASFFDEVSGLSRVVNVDKLYLGNSRGVEDETHVRVDARCVATTYRYLQENERIQATEDTQKKKKRKVRKSKT